MMRAMDSKSNLSIGRLRESDSNPHNHQSVRHLHWWMTISSRACLLMMSLMDWHKKMRSMLVPIQALSQARMVTMWRSPMQRFVYNSINHQVVKLINCLACQQLAKEDFYWQETPKKTKVEWKQLSGSNRQSSPLKRARVEDIDNDGEVPSQVQPSKVYFLPSLSLYQTSLFLWFSLPRFKTPFIYSTPGPMSMHKITMGNLVTSITNVATVRARFVPSHTKWNMQQMVGILYLFQLHCSH